jgi:hypothetical protein
MPARLRISPPVPILSRAAAYTEATRAGIMRALAFWKTVTADRVDLLDRILELLDGNVVRYCVIGGQGVNAYVEPVVSLDLDLALASGEQGRIEGLLRPPLVVRRFAHSLNVSQPGSDLRIQFQTDARYAEFVGRATRRSVLGCEVPVAAVEDVLSGKVWAAQDPGRRASKRQKDLADIARLVEAFPQLRAQVPADVLAKLL